MSGKEAQIYLVTLGEKLCVAKVYKDAQTRSFKNRAAYTEGRKVRNSRDQRAMEKRSKHGREQEEVAWRSTEVDVIYRLQAGGVRVPAPYYFIDGVLLMELVVGADGNPAPRLGDVAFEPAEAEAIYGKLMREVVRMLCAGVVHGDLSDFNVLLAADGPVIIDFPQSVDTAHNNSARQLLVRDVDNLHHFLQQYVPDARRFPYAEEMWDLHQANALTPETKLTGRYRAAERRVNVSNVLGLIDDANRDERKRRDSLGLRGGPSAQPESPTGRYGASSDARPYNGGSAPRQQNGGPRPYNGDSGPRQQNGGPRPYNGGASAGRYSAPADTGSRQRSGAPNQRSSQSRANDVSQQKPREVEVVVIRRPSR